VVAAIRNIKEMRYTHQGEAIQNNNLKEKKYLDSSMARWLQYLRSSIPVIVIAFDDILMQRAPLFFRIENSFLWHQRGWIGTDERKSPSWSSACRWHLHRHSPRHRRSRLGPQGSGSWRGAWRPRRSPPRLHRGRSCWGGPPGRSPAGRGRGVPSPRPHRHRHRTRVPEHHLHLPLHP